MRQMGPEKHFVIKLEEYSKLKTTKTQSKKIYPLHFKFNNSTRQIKQTSQTLKIAKKNKK